MERYMLKRIKRAVEIISDGIYTRMSPLQITAYVTPETVPFSKRESGKMINPAVGDSWGKLWDCAWFRFDCTVPDGAVGKSLVLLLDVSGEMCIVDDSGVPAACITNVASTFDRNLGEPAKRSFALSRELCSRGSFSLWADAGCNDLFGKYCDSGKVMEASLASFDSELESIYYDFVVLLDAVNCLDSDTARRKRLLQKVYDAACLVTSEKPWNRTEVKSILAAELSKKCGDMSLRVTAVGHAHTDLAWLWPLRETRRKGARTFSHAVSLMDKYPDYIFGASQPQLYKWVKEDYPELFEKVKQRVRENRWECQGAMWVESDTNVSGGEPLVRQFLYGKRFFREEFGKDIRVLWLPDVFGYNGNLPQLMKKSGVDYFVTQKISWSEHNKFPHHTFNWQGIDGSTVLAHMLPEDTYNGAAMPRSLMKIEKNYLDNAVCEEALMLFGIGDGAGGPGTAHLEGLKRMKQLEGFVPCEQGYSVDMLDRIADNSAEYATWKGELYLEKHQATYTTQSRIKRFNRKTEFLLHETEFACTWAKLAVGLDYPKGRLDAIWEEFLLYQFHDILPGSSISRVYKEAEERFAVICKELTEMKKEAYRAIAAQYARQGESLVFNSLSFEVETQLKTTAGCKSLTVPAFGAVSLTESADKQTNFTISEKLLENDALRVVFGDNGEIAEIYDKRAARQVLKAGKSANLLCIYSDDGDAWDMRIDYREAAPEQMKLVSFESCAEGVNCVKVQTFTYNNSTLEQRIVLTPDGVIRFETKADWREKGKMLRTDFPIDVFTDTVDCEIQFGSLKRSATENTSWDWAQYEICAQKWIDKSQRDYGAAILNNGKYGYCVRRDSLDINLLRSSDNPDVNADYGKHAFTYAFFPHKGDYVEGEVVKKAYELNMPVSVVKAEKGCIEPSRLPALFEVEGENVMVETVKMSEDGRGVIVRAYECAGGEATLRLKPSFRFSRASIVNLVENEVSECATSGGIIEAAFKPFEIVTVKIR